MKILTMASFQGVLCLFLIFGFCNGFPAGSVPVGQKAGNTDADTPFLRREIVEESHQIQGKTDSFALSSDQPSDSLLLRRQKRATENDAKGYVAVALLICILLIIIIILLLCGGCYLMKALNRRRLHSFTTADEIAYIRKLGEEDVIVKHPNWREWLNRLYCCKNFKPKCFKKAEDNDNKDAETVDIKDKEVIQKKTVTTTESEKKPSEEPRVSTLERIRQTSQTQIANLRGACSRICARPPAEDEPNQEATPGTTTTITETTTTRTWTRGLHILGKEESTVQKSSAEIEEEARKKREEFRLRELEKLKKAEEAAERKRKEREEKEATLKMKRDRERQEAEEKRKIKEKEKSELEAKEKIRREKEAQEAEERKKLKEKEKNDLEEKKRQQKEQREKERLEKEEAEKLRKAAEAERLRQKKEKERLEEIEKQKQKLLAEAQKPPPKISPEPVPEPKPAPPLITTTTITTVLIKQARKAGTKSEIILADAAQGPPGIEDPNLEQVHVLKKDGAYIPKNPDLTVEQIKAFTHTNPDHEVEVPGAVTEA